MRAAVSNSPASPAIARRYRREGRGEYKVCAAWRGTDRDQLRARALRLRLVRAPHSCRARTGSVRDRHHRRAAVRQFCTGHADRALYRRSTGCPQHGGAVRRIRRRRPCVGEPVRRRAVAGCRGVCLRHLHRPDDARAHGRHAGVGETLSARAHERSNERTYQRRRGVRRSGGPVSGRRLAIRLRVVRHRGDHRNHCRVALHPLGVADHTGGRRTPAPDHRAAVVAPVPALDVRVRDGLHRFGLLDLCARSCDHARRHGRRPDRVAMARGRHRRTRGAVVSDLADRNNPAVTHALMLVMLSASLALLAASPGQLVIATFSALVFGLSYMSLTGLYLLTGIRLLPGRLSLGPVLPFLAVAVGQAVGSPIVGLLVKQLGYADAFAMFSALGILVATLSPWYPRYIEDLEEEDEPEEEPTGLQAAFDYQLQDEQGEPFHLTTTTTPEEPRIE